MFAIAHIYVDGHNTHSEKCRSISLEGSFELSSRGSLNASGLGESDSSLSELDGGITLDILIIDDGGLDDLDGLTSTTVATAHLHVHLGDGSAKGHVSEFLVHVNGGGTGVVSEEDAVVSHDTGSLLEDLAGGNDLSLDASDLVLSLHVIPELGSGKDLVSSENANSVEDGVRCSFGRQLSSNNIVLVNLGKIDKQSVRHMFQGKHQAALRNMVGQVWQKHLDNCYLLSFTSRTLRNLWPFLDKK